MKIITDFRRKPLTKLKEIYKMRSYAWRCQCHVGTTRSVLMYRQVSIGCDRKDEV